MDFMLHTFTLKITVSLGTYTYYLYLLVFHVLMFLVSFIIYCLELSKLNQVNFPMTTVLN